MNTKSFSIEIGGKKLIAEFSDLASQADGACFMTCGETTVLVTAVQSNAMREGIDFFPLSVNYEEKFYAAGMLLGSKFVRREGGASEAGTLNARLIDRSIRPLFDKSVKNETQVVALPLSIDDQNSPDNLAIIAASLALGTSNIPWNGPASAVRIAKKGGEFIINPTYEDREDCDLDVIVCGKKDRLNMIEASSKEISNEDAIKAFEIASKEIKKLCEFQEKIIKEIGKPKKELLINDAVSKIKGVFDEKFAVRLGEAIYIKEKAARNEALDSTKQEWIEAATSRADDESEKSKILQAAEDILEDAINDIVHKNVIKDDKRPDGRGLKEIRPLFAKTHFLPRLHGSGVFFRGETHIMSAVTLGAPSDYQLIEGMEVRKKKQFIHHYNFPPFSVGEIKSMRGPGRRDIGHGALAERALSKVIPDQKTFPYTIRIVSETMSSNGSSSMGSVCASTLALMDAGVPIKDPVAGIAMGLMMEDEKYKVITDIQGYEDHYGDMDLKVAGTKNGVTALQMDIKVDGVTTEILKEALVDAQEARMQILECITKEIPEPRKELNKTAPRIVVMHIDTDKIRDVIGPGGKVINSINERTGASIDVEQDGTIYIAGATDENVEKAREEIALLTKEFKIGETAKGKVSRIFEFGAMVEIAPSQEGLVHISELAPFRVNKVEDMVTIGDEVPVKVIGIDEKGRINLSIKEVAVLEQKKGVKSSQENNRTNNRPQRRGNGPARGQRRKNW
ncbi:polyribonucleotide nucleotidyltransferase [Patescibacteria group bacterium]